MKRSAFSVSFALMVSFGTLAAAPDGDPAHALARQLSASFGDVYEKVSPGVVVIEADPPMADVRTRQDALAQFFFQDPSDGSQGIYRQKNQGSGFIITQDGYILTNNHVLEGAARDGVHVTLQDGRKFDATVVGIDRISDLAVLKIDATSLPVVELGDSDKARVGEFAFALGAPYDLRYSFTYGIISAKGRTDLTGNPNYEEFIQTDAAINPGNSGGPLVNIDGQVVGVNTMVHGIDQGLGFAIPINIAKQIATQLIADGRVSRPWLGIGIIGVEDTPFAEDPDIPKGVIVSGIEPGTPAGLSDLRPRDIILSVDGASVQNARDLQKTILTKAIGQEVELEVWRNTRLLKVKVRTAERTEGMIRAANRLRGPGYQQEISSPLAGLQVEPLTADAAIAMKTRTEHGLVVTYVDRGSPADVAGVKVGDVITSAGRQPVATIGELAEQIGGGQDDGVLLDIDRGGQKTFAIIKQ